MKNKEDFYPSDEMKSAIDRFHQQLRYLSRSKILQLLVAKGLEIYLLELRKTGAINIEMPDYE